MGRPVSRAMTTGCSYSAACSAGRGFFGAIQNAAGRSNRKLAPAVSAIRQIASAPSTPAMVTISEIVPMSWIDAGAQQQRPRRRHRQEEREIDHDGMLAAEAQEIEPMRPRQQRARS